MRNVFPIHLRQKIGDRLAFDIRLQTDEPGDGLVEIDDAALLVHHQHAVFNRVKQGFEKAALPREPLDDGLQTLRIQPTDATKHFVEKTGFGRRHLTNY